jgi:probable HAF family extracellular repeat protein
MVDLGWDSKTVSNATGVNESGQIVGAYEIPYINRACIWTRGGGGMVDLGALGGTGAWAEAAGVNSSGQIVGDSTTGPGDPNSEGPPYDHATLWMPAH